MARYKTPEWQGKLASTGGPPLDGVIHKRERGLAPVAAPLR